jgi:hypothetical protein
MTASVLRLRKSSSTLGMVAACVRPNYRFSIREPAASSSQVFMSADMVATQVYVRGEWTVITLPDSVANDSSCIAAPATGVRKPATVEDGDRVIDDLGVDDSALSTAWPSAR